MIERTVDKESRYIIVGFTSDVDPDWLYPDPDPQNLINPDQDPGQ